MRETEILRGLHKAHNNFVRGTPFVQGKPGIDKVPAKLTRGEAVLPAATVAKVGPQNIARLISNTNNGVSPSRGLRAGAHYVNGVVDLPGGPGLPEVPATPNMRTANSPAPQTPAPPTAVSRGTSGPAGQFGVPDGAVLPEPAPRAAPPAGAQSVAGHMSGVPAGEMPPNLGAPAVAPPPQAPLAPEIPTPTAGAAQAAETAAPTSRMERVVQGAKDFGQRAVNAVKGAVGAGGEAAPTSAASRLNQMGNATVDTAELAKNAADAAKTVGSVPATLTEKALTYGSKLGKLLGPVLSVADIVRDPSGLGIAQGAADVAEGLSGPAGALLAPAELLTRSLNNGRGVVQTMGDRFSGRYVPKTAVADNNKLLDFFGVGKSNLTTPETEKLMQTPEMQKRIDPPKVDEAAKAKAEIDAKNAAAAEANAKDAAEARARPFYQTPEDQLKEQADAEVNGRQLLANALTTRAQNMTNYTPDNAGNTGNSGVRSIRDNAQTRDAFNFAHSTRGDGINYGVTNVGGKPQLEVTGTAPSKPQYVGADGTPTNDWSQTADYAQGLQRAAGIKSQANAIDARHEQEYKDKMAGREADNAAYRDSQVSTKGMNTLQIANLRNEQARQREEARGHTLGYGAQVYGHDVQARGQDVAAQTAMGQQGVGHEANQVALYGHQATAGLARAKMNMAFADAAQQSNENAILQRYGKVDDKTGQLVHTPESQAALSAFYADPSTHPRNINPREIGDYLDAYDIKADKDKQNSSLITGAKTMLGGPKPGKSKHFLEYLPQVRGKGDYTTSGRHAGTTLPSGASWNPFVTNDDDLIDMQRRYTKEK